MAGLIMDFFVVFCFESDCIVVASRNRAFERAEVLRYMAIALAGRIEALSMAVAGNNRTTKQTPAIKFVHGSAVFVGLLLATRIGQSIEVPKDPRTDRTQN
jgi:hypothetical protein